MNIALIVPPYADNDLEMACKESIGVCYLAAVLRRNDFEVTLIDADLLGLSFHATAKRILHGKYDLVGFSVLEGTIESVEAILQLLVDGGLEAHVLLGGYFPTMLVEEVLEKLTRVDSIILGEAEFSLLSLAIALRDGRDWQHLPGVACRISGGVCVNPCDTQCAVDDLPFPERDLLPEVLRRGGVTGVVGSRGCFEGCSFCCMNRFSQLSGVVGWRGRSPVSIGDELEKLVELWGVRAVSFYDGNFIGPGEQGVERAHAIADEIIKRNLDLHFAISTRADQVERELFLHLKNAGLSEVFVGLESMTQRILDLYNKHTRVEDNIKAVEILEECKIYFRAGFILYEPHITLAEIRENIDFLAKMVDMHYCNKFFFFKALRVYRGSRMEAKLAREGILISNGWHVAYNWKHAEVGEYIRITGQICSQIINIVQQIQSFDSDIKRYFETLLGKWNIQVHSAVLLMIEHGAISQNSYMDLSVRAADELKTIRQKLQRFAVTQSGTTHS